VAEYLDFRIVTAGGATGLFNAGAMDQLYRYSGGIPRKINHAASLALLEGFGREARIIDEAILENVMLELEALPLG
jgi:type II secretory pathway predicted ATPase ExeA